MSQWEANSAVERIASLTDASTNGVTINGNKDNVNLTDTSDSNGAIAGNRDDVNLVKV
jgi:hypothetical protein